MAPVNKAAITLIPKKEGAVEISDFRPISVINTSAKIVTKILANRLQPLLPILVNSAQTAFVRGRSIMESYLVAREYLSHFQQRRIPSILYKVDFAKAFDTVDWSFLINLLLERGFPPKWLSAVLNILRTSTSTIKINGSITAYFKHKRGLRQGDPLSPLLFILVTDSLYWFIQNAVPTMHSPMLIAPRPIQYADDTIIVTEAHPLTLRVIARILHIYECLAGLKINRRKSSFVPIAIPPHLLPAIRNIIGCTAVQLPITYLGLPLTCKRLRKVDFQPLINSIRSRMASWSSSILSYGGRVTLLKSVLTALPLHYMQAMKLPKGVINHIDKARRSFLWKGNEACKGINCLVNWETVCTSNGVHLKINCYAH